MQIENCTFLEDKDIANQKMYLGDNKILVCNLLLEQSLFRHSIYSKGKGCKKIVQLMVNKFQASTNAKR